MTGTSTLYSRPSFLRGLAAALDIGSTLTIYNESKTGEEADSKAIYSDWVAVGDNISFALDTWECEHVKK